MMIDEKYMIRCLEIAKNGGSYTHPNPYVGAVIVNNDKIIGEGFHRKFGEAHAEVNAINSVKDKSLLKDSTIYVSLEPCSHYGKTPPCTEIIIKHKIKNVVVATSDTNSLVAGGGIEILKKHGINVITGVLEKEARELNKVFFVNHEKKRPFIILKWAQSKDGFIDRCRTSIQEGTAEKISNDITNSIAHKLRTEVQSIMVGTNTAILDNPMLNSRLWKGNNPARIIIDKDLRTPNNYNVFNGESATYVFTAKDLDNTKENIIYKKIDFSNDIEQQIINILFENNILSILVEGGSKLLSSFIQKELWDEAFIEISDKIITSGIKCPEIDTKNALYKNYLSSTQLYLKNKIN